MRMKKLLIAHLRELQQEMETMGWVLATPIQKEAVQKLFEQTADTIQILEA